MAKKISELPVVDTLLSTDKVVVNHDGATSTIPVEDLLPKIDDEPAEGSSNPVASGGVYEALKSAGGIPDWIQEDPAETDFIRNKPFYRTVASSSNLWKVTGTSFSITSYGTEYAYTNYCSGCSLMTIGKEYRVTVTLGQCSVTEDIVAKSYSSTYLRLTGNAFLIEQNKSSNKVRIGLKRSVFTDSGSISLLIKVNTYTYVKLPEEYLDTSFAAPQFKDTSNVSGSSTNYASAYVLLTRNSSYYRCLFADAFNDRLSASGLASQIDDLYDSLSDLASSVTSMNSTLKKRVSALEKEQDGYETEIADLQEQIQALRARVAYLESLHAGGDSTVTITVDGTEVSFDGSGASVVDGELVIDSAEVSVENGVLIYGSDASGVVVTASGNEVSFDGAGASVTDGELVLNSPVIYMIDGVLVYGSDTSDSGMVMDGDALSLSGATIEDGVLIIDSSLISVDDGTVTSETEESATVSDGDLSVTGTTVNSTGELELGENATIEDGVLAIS